MEHLIVTESGMSAQIEAIKQGIVVVYGGIEIPQDMFTVDPRGTITIDEAWMHQQQAAFPEIIQNGEISLSIGVRAQGGDAIKHASNQLELSMSAAGHRLMEKYANTEYSIRRDRRNAKGPGKTAQWKNERNRYGRRG